MFLQPKMNQMTYQAMIRICCNHLCIKDLLDGHSIWNGGHTIKSYNPIQSNQIYKVWSILI